MKKGFSLLELILVLGIGTSLAFIKFQDMVRDEEGIKASGAGQEIKQLGDAVNGYINIRYDKLSTLVNSAGTGTDPGPRTCSTDNSICTITSQTLVNEGLLPTTYIAKNTFGSDYTIQLKRSGTEPNYLIDGIIVTNSAWVEGGSIRYDMLGKAMQAAGIDSGMTKLATQLDGYGGNWNYQSSTYPAISKTGVLGYRVGYNSAMYSVYLRRDGTLPMTGNLNMGANDINNAKNITASGTGSFGGNIAAAGQSVTDMPANWSGLRTQDVLGNGTIAIGNSNAGSYVWKAYMNNGGNIYASNNISTDGTINANGNITSNAETYTQNWFRTLGDGGIYFQKYGGGWNMGDTNTINAFGGKNIQTSAGLYGGYVHSNGNIDAAGTVNAQYVWASGNLNSNYVHSNGNVDAAGDMNSNRVFSNYVHSNGNVDAAGDMNSNRVLSNYVQSNGRVTAGEYVQINGQAGVGGGCSPNGLIGRDGSGKILSCVNGLWASSGGSAWQACRTCGGQWPYMIANFTLHGDSGVNFNGYGPSCSGPYTNGVSNSGDYMQLCASSQP